MSGFVGQCNPRYVSQHPICAGCRGPACASTWMGMCHRCPFRYINGNHRLSTPQEAPLGCLSWSHKRPSQRLESAARKAQRCLSRRCRGMTARQAPCVAPLLRAKASQDGCLGSRRRAAPNEQFSGDNLSSLSFKTKVQQLDSGARMCSPRTHRWRRFVGPTCAVKQNSLAEALAADSWANWVAARCQAPLRMILRASKGMFLWACRVLDSYAFQGLQALALFFVLVVPDIMAIYSVPDSADPIIDALLLATMVVFGGDLFFSFTCRPKMSWLEVNDHSSTCVCFLYDLTL